MPRPYSRFHPPIEPESEHADAFMAWAAMFRAMHLQRQLMGRTLHEHGSNPGQAACLREVGHNDGISQRDLAEKLHVTRPAVTMMLQKMEKAGLVERVTDPEDQRLTRIHLTAAGGEKHEEMHRLLGEVVNMTTAKLPHRDQAELARILGDLSDHMAQALGEGTGEGGFTFEHDACAREDSEEGEL